MLLHGYSNVITSHDTVGKNSRLGINFQIARKPFGCQRVKSNMSSITHERGHFISPIGEIRRVETFNKCFLNEIIS